MKTLNTNKHIEETVLKKIVETALNNPYTQGQDTSKFLTIFESDGLYNFGVGLMISAIAEDNYKPSWIVSVIVLNHLHQKISPNLLPKKPTIKAKEIIKEIFSYIGNFNANQIRQNSDGFVERRFLSQNDLKLIPQEFYQEWRK